MRNLRQALDEIQLVTNLQWSTQEQDGQQLCLSQALDENQGQKLLERLNPSLAPALFQSDTGEYFIAFNAQYLIEILDDNNQSIWNMNYLPLISMVAEQKYGAQPVNFQGNEYVPIGAKADLADPLTQRYLLIQNPTANSEMQFVDQDSPFMQDIYHDVLAQIQGKSIEEILNLVNERIDEITSVHTGPKGEERIKLELEMNARIIDYRAKRARGEIAGKPKNVDIPLDELIEAGILVCRHKSIIAASIIGKLIRNNLLLKGSVRNYRSYVHDQAGEITGGHAWSVYHDIVNDKIWIIDPRNLFVTEVNPLDLEEANSTTMYGMPALKQMVSRIEAFDRPLLEQRLQQQIQNANSIADLQNIISKFTEKHKLYGSNGHVIDANNLELMISNMSLFTQEQSTIEKIIKQNAVVFNGSGITRNYGLQAKYVSLVKQSYENDLYAHQLVDGIKNQFKDLISNHPEISFPEKLIEQTLSELNELLEDQDFKERCPEQVFKESCQQRVVDKLNETKVKAFSVPNATMVMQLVDNIVGKLNQAKIQSATERRSAPLVANRNIHQGNKLNPQSAPQQQDIKKKQKP